MKSQVLGFSIKRCVNGTGNVCKTPEQINNFISDIEINVWKIEQTFDFNNYNHPPTYRVMEVIRSDYLKTNEWIYLYLRL